ncbi:hypothetical protein MKZ38_006593 [Zalerion maritima]|uniref:Uncharacterized protein n=1 Tax=Zalerion maritima TaxID=339359 RepID=A0AAD5RJS9_9PEZI|nr:hypothetical protein MKZ38_006593 [Zalerion maritima]
MSNVNIVSARAPTKYGGSTSTWAAPPPSWMSRTWVITHSTLKTRASAKNCRVTYSTTTSSHGKVKLSQTSKTEAKGKLHTSTTTSVGARNADAVGEFEAKGKGFMKNSSRWEVLGWGDITNDNGEVVESWMIVYHAPSTGAKEGVDVMTSRKEGMGSETAQRCINALKRLPDGANKLKNSVVMDLRVIDIVGPWKE